MPPAVVRETPVKISSAIGAFVMVSWSDRSGKDSPPEKSRVGMVMPSVRRKPRLMIMRVGNPSVGPAVANRSPDEGQREIVAGRRQFFRAHELLPAYKLKISQDTKD